MKRYKIPVRIVSLLLSVLLLAACQQKGAESQVTSSHVESITASQQDEVLHVGPEDSSLTEADPEPVEHRISFSAVGDNLIHNSIYQSAQAKAGGEGYDFSYAYENASYFFEDYDINWINQETLVNSELPAATYPCFSTPGELGQAAYDAGWRVYAMSNNHTYDMGATGISATLRYWDGMPDDVVTYGLFTGTQDDSGIALQEVDGVTIAYVAFTENTNGLPTPSGTEAFVIYTSEYEAMEHKVRRAREMADIVVVSVHWGVENSHNVVDGQRSLGQSFADWGADVIIGTHPHVIQEMEWLQSEDGRNVLIAYSLGNFLSAQSQPNQLVGLALTFEFALTEKPDGTKTPVQVENVQVYPTVTQYEYDGGPRYLDPRVYMYRDYTDELASQHQVRTINSSFGRQYVEDLCRQYISEEFLVLD